MGPAHSRQMNKNKTTNNLTFEVVLGKSVRLAGKSAAENITYSNMNREQEHIQDDGKAAWELRAAYYAK